MTCIGSNKTGQRHLGPAGSERRCRLIQEAFALAAGFLPWLEPTRDHLKIIIDHYRTLLDRQDPQGTDAFASTGPAVLSTTRPPSPAGPVCRFGPGGDFVTDWPDLGPAENKGGTPPC